VALVGIQNKDTKDCISQRRVKIRSGAANIIKNFSEPIDYDVIIVHQPEHLKLFTSVS